MYALALGRCAPSGIVRTYQVMHTCLCYNYYISLTTGIYFDISPTIGKYKKCSPVFSFDLRCQSALCNSYNIGMSDLPEIYTFALGPVRATIFIFPYGRGYVYQNISLWLGICNSAALWTYNSMKSATVYNVQSISTKQWLGQSDESGDLLTVFLSHASSTTPKL